MVVDLAATLAFAFLDSADVAGEADFGGKGGAHLASLKSETPPRSSTNWSASEYWGEVFSCGALTEVTAKEGLELPVDRGGRRRLWAGALFKFVSPFARQTRPNPFQLPSSFGGLSDIRFTTSTNS